VAHYLMPLRYGPGEALGALLAAGGMIAALLGLRRRRDPQTILLLAAFALLSAPLFATRYLPYRYALPLMPLMALFAARSLVMLLDRLARRRGAAAALIALLLLPGAARSAWLGHLLAREDTRSLAGQWIRRNAPPGAPVIILGPPECEPQLPESHASLRRRIEYVRARYGSRAGEIVAAPYRLLLRASEPPGAFDILRNPSPDQWPRGGHVLVTPRHPLLAPANDQVAASAVSFALASPFARTEIRGLARPVPPRAFERIDAFFLPMSRLESVQRPGPDLILGIREAAAP
jgi:hypothetical protein